MLGFAGAVFGAVYMPVVSMVPQMLKAQLFPVTTHLMSAAERLPVKMGWKSWVVPAATVTLSGLTPMVPEDGEVVRQP